MRRELKNKNRKKKLKKEKSVKVIQEVVEVPGEGLEAIMGKKVTLLCANYFYTGVLIGVNATCVKLKDPAIVYETGAWTEKNYSDEQPIHAKEFYVHLSAIESFGILK